MTSWAWPPAPACCCWPCSACATGPAGAATCLHCCHSSPSSSSESRISMAVTTGRAPAAPVPAAPLMPAAVPTLPIWGRPLGAGGSERGSLAAPAYAKTQQERDLSTAPCRQQCRTCVCSTMQASGKRELHPPTMHTQSSHHPPMLHTNRSPLRSAGAGGRRGQSWLVATGSCTHLLAQRSCRLCRAAPPGCWQLQPTAPPPPPPPPRHR
jgi:hypothetical protein